MNHKLRFSFSLLLLPLFAGCVSPKLPGVGAAMQSAIDAREISGAVTVVVTKDKFIHLETTGLADVAAKKLVFVHSVDIRGNTNESWTRGLTYLLKNYLLAGQ